ncbi:nucleotide exchange factor GrpE [Candidatus Woesearchaeota archaeon]|nr:nucleotide exchange factor GrpE [Candidatus Woesearchaeota archaeon]
MTAKKTKKITKDSKALTESLQRLQAEFENYKKREENNKLQTQQYLIGDFAKKFLPIIDNFELALKNKTSNDDPFIKGIELLYAQLVSVLEEYNIKKINTKNVKFDPKLHEAMMMVESKKESNTIIEEFQSGYLIGEKVLRHSKVKVAK